MRLLKLLLFMLLISNVASAVDFKLRDYDGHDFRIADEKTDYTLVFLYNSDCDVCKKGAAQIEHSKAVNSLLANKRIRVVSVAMFEEADDWKRKAATFPSDWTHCSDAYDELLEGDALSFETVPCYFVLDSSHKVVKSDISFTVIDKFLQEILNFAPQQEPQQLK